MLVVLVYSEPMLRLRLRFRSWSRLLVNLQVSNVSAQWSDVLILTESVHVNGCRLEEDWRIHSFGDVMFILGHRRMNLHVGSETVLDEIVLFLTETRILMVLRWSLLELRPLVNIRQIRSSLLNKSTLEHILVDALGVLVILVRYMLIVLLQWL